jgi:4-hydroxy-3-methylbut-2-enyl diphosphate reductase
MSIKTFDVSLANPRGFCAGVDRAIEIVERALKKFGSPVYVHHEIVHNKHVVDDLRAKGAVFIETPEDVPEGAVLIFSAHGVSKTVRKRAEKLTNLLFDATCPLVTKVHVEVQKMYREGYQLVMIGHKGHPEVEGTMGQLEQGISLVETVADVQNLPFSETTKIAYVSQTTLSVDDTQQIVDALRARFPLLRSPKMADICYATQNRQDAIKVLAKETDLILVIGSPNSSNSNRLKEVAERLGIEAHLIENAEAINPLWLSGKNRIGVSAGASAPEKLVQELLIKLKQLGAISVHQIQGETENVHFPLPKGLKLDKNPEVV